MTKIITRAAAIDAGLVRYFTGEPCIRGHVSERFVSSGGCCQCGLESDARLRAKIRDRRAQVRAAQGGTE